MKLGIISVVLTVLLAASALAVANVDYHYNVNSVHVQAYNCADAGCNSVTGFSGTLPQGQDTSNGVLRVSYPTQLVGDGYAVYHLAEGYVPVEKHATWWGSGSTDVNIDFHKIDNCASVIDTFTVTNDAHANVPLVVRTSASLDATTRSAFKLTSNGVGYVPDAFKADYYSADTRVTLTIKDASGQVRNEQSQDLTAANGNALFASESRQVEFSWTPATDGVYTATVTTDVIDNQCSSKIPQSASSQFSVLPALPQNECYTILNGLAANPIVGVTGQSVSLSFNKISNQANNYAFNGDPNYRLTPVPTDITYSISDATGAVIDTHVISAGANPDNMNPSAQGFSFTPASTGMHLVTVTGLANSPLCTGLLNIPNTITLNVNVVAPPTHNIIFQIVDGTTGNALSGATITVASQTLTTDASGTATATGLSPADYSYTISKSGFVTQTGIVHLVDTDMYITLALQREPIGNQGKVIFTVQNALTLAIIPGATVTLDSAQQTTDADGLTTFNAIASGTHAWSGAAAGYNTATGSVTTNGNDDEQVMISLTSTNDGGPRTVTIHVYDSATNTNLAGATVTLSGAGLAPNGISAVTGPNGLVVFTGVPQGAYSWFVSLSGYTSAQGGVDVAATDVTVQVPLTQQTTPTVHTVTYHVIDAQTGAALQGAQVTFNGGNVATTDANGNVVYSGVVDGTYAFGVTLAGYDPASGTTQVTGADVLVTVPLTHAGLVHQVTFHVTDGNTGINLPGVAIVFDGRSGTTDNSGTVVFSNVPDNTYTYTATLNGYSPASGSFVVAGSDVTVPVQLFVMVGPNTVTIHVYDDVSGANLPGAFVRFDGQQGVTDISGTIVFQHVPNGSFPWDVALAGYNTASGTQTVSGDLVMQVPLHRTIPGTQHLATFSVVDSQNGAAIAGATVTIGSGATAVTGTTAVNGMVTLTLFDGTYTFSVSATNYNSKSGTVTIAGSDVFVLVQLDRNGGPTPVPQPTPEMGIFIGSIRIPEINAAGGDVPILITFKNDGDVHLDGVKAVAVSQDLGLRAVIGPFDLSTNSQVSQRIILHTDDAKLQPGLYPIRLTVSNDDITRVVYRDLEVLP